MERTPLCSNIRSSQPYSHHCRPMLARPGPMAATWQLRRAARLGSTALQSCSCLSRKGYISIYKRLQKSSLMAFSSYESKEIKLDNGEIMSDKLLIDCGEDQECVIGGIVALGKFDALHIGHRQLAIHASKAGTPFLLSFVGMAEVLGWEFRPPIVANGDRERVLSTWSGYCGNVTPIEYQVEFSKVRYLTPREFVEKLAKELRISGVVAGENYRFGYRASGDATELVRLCNEFGLEVFIVSSVMDKFKKSLNGSSRVSVNPSDKGQVSSSRVRHALSIGDMDYVTELLGRKHRLILKLDENCKFEENKRILVPKSCELNLSPMDSSYENCTLLVDDLVIGDCRVIINGEMIEIELKDESFRDRKLIQNCKLLGVEFG